MDHYQVVNHLLVTLFNDIMDIEEREVISGEFTNITNNDMHIIEAIGPEEERTMGATAKKMGVTVGTLTIAINNLVKKGYVKRSRSEKDRRVVLISLTELGERAYKHHQKFHRNMVKATMEEISDEEAEVLCSALTRLSNFFSEKNKK